MTPKTPEITKPAFAATRADASVTAQEGQVPAGGYSTITTSSSGKLQKKARTGKTITTGGTT